MLRLAARPARSVKKIDVISPALQVFKVPPTDISIQDYSMPSGPANQPPTGIYILMEFTIQTLDDLEDLSRSYFTMELRLKRVPTLPLFANEKLWPVNYAGSGRSSHKLISI